ncbi:hypothetical protein Taro_004859 [Colocasia esculenta]|uniref:Uncharacterized protein n=1 Tax=Colocasia esculenta TaxID=4460 RepID=A0A843TNG8_COLES|nr:hypothetical protein [Colocasia esculenta]
MIRARAAGCSCCCAVCVASVVARRARAVAARLALDSLAVVFLVWRTLAGKSKCSVCCVASLGERCDTCLWSLSAWCWLVVSSSEAEDCFALISAVAVLPQSLRCAVGLAGAFWRVFPEWCLGGFGGGSPRTFLCSSQECSVFVSGHRCVFPMVRSVPFGCAAFWCCFLGRASGCCVGQLASLFILSFSAALVGLRVSPWLGWFVSFLVPCMLSQMVVWAGASMAYCALSGLWFCVWLLGSIVYSCLSVLISCRLEPGCIEFYLGWLPVLVIAPCVVLGACLCLVVIPLPLWSGCFALSRRFLCAVGNYVLCRVLLATEWVANRLVPIARSVGGCSRVVFGWRFPLFGPDLALLGTSGIVVPVMSGVPDTTVIPVAMQVCIAFLSRPGFPSGLSVAIGQRFMTAFCPVGRLTPLRVAGVFITRRGGPLRSGCRGLKALASYPFPLSLLFFPFPSSPAMGRLPSGDLGVERPAARGGAWERCRGARRRWPYIVKALRGLGIAVAVHLWVAIGLLSRHLARSQQGYHSALPRRDGVAMALGVATVPVLPRVLPWAWLCVGVCPRAGLGLRTFCQWFGMVLLCCPACSPGAWHLRACPRSERLLPLHGTPIVVSLLRVALGYERARAWDTEDGRSSTRCRLVSPLSHCLSLRWFWSHVVVSGMRPQLGQAAVLPVLCVSVAALSRPCAGVEAGARLTRASGGFRLVSSRFRSPIHGCQSVVAPACVAPRPCGVSGVRGGSACGPSSLWRCVEGYFRYVLDSVGFCGSRFLLLFPVRD